MAINKKNKNRLNLNGKEYLWWVFNEHDQTEFDGIQVKVVCSDQTHFFKYGLQQSETDRKVVFALRDYTKTVHISSPSKFENEEGIITKSGIIKLIEWCKKGKHQIKYASDRMNNKLTDDGKLLLLKDLQMIIN